ncbi:hypothetical protein PENTCL1PPCAC_25744, partial [Pristionchus entomophagus]
WWLVCPPTFGATHKKVAKWHVTILVLVAISFLWLSRSVPNYLEERNDKEYSREVVEKVFITVGYIALPFALSGVISLRFTRPNFIVPTAVFYSMLMMFAVVPFMCFATLAVGGILVSDLEALSGAIIPLAVIVLLFAYLLHGYGTMMRVRNDMRDDHLDANPHLIPDSE